MSNVKVEWYGGSVIASMKQAIPKALEAAAIVVTMDAVPRVPVDTGNLRGSITHKVEGAEAKVGTNVDYAPHVEYGTHKMDAKPYLRPAIDAQRANIENILGLTLGKAAEAGGK